MAEKEPGLFENFQADPGTFARVGFPLALFAHKAIGDRARAKQQMDAINQEVTRAQAISSIADELLQSGQGFGGQTVQTGLAGALEGKGFSAERSQTAAIAAQTRAQELGRARLAIADARGFAGLNLVKDESKIPPGLNPEERERFIRRSNNLDILNIEDAAGLGAAASQVDAANLQREGERQKQTGIQKTNRLSAKATQDAKDASVAAARALAAGDIEAVSTALETHPDAQDENSALSQSKAILDLLPPGSPLTTQFAKDMLADLGEAATAVAKPDSEAAKSKAAVTYLEGIRSLAPEGPARTRIDKAIEAGGPAATKMMNRQIDINNQAPTSGEDATAMREAAADTLTVLAADLPEGGLKTLALAGARNPILAEKALATVSGKLSLDEDKQDTSNAERIDFLTDVRDGPDFEDFPSFQRTMINSGIKRGGVAATTAMQSLGNKTFAPETDEVDPNSAFIQRILDDPDLSANLSDNQKKTLQNAADTRGDAAKDGALGLMDNLGLTSDMERILASPLGKDILAEKFAGDAALNQMLSLEEFAGSDELFGNYARGTQFFQQLGAKFGLDSEGEITTSRQALEAISGRVLAAYVKGISGAAVSEQEAQRLALNLPTANDSPGQFRTKLAISIQIMTEDQELKKQQLDLIGRGDVAGSLEIGDRRHTRLLRWDALVKERDGEVPLAQSPAEVRAAMARVKGGAQ